MSIATSTVSFAAQMLAFVTLPFLFQSVLGRSAFETGLLMTPWPLALGVDRAARRAPCRPGAGRADRRASAWRSSRLGLFTLSGSGRQPATVDIAWRMALCGIGFGLFQSPNNRTIVSSAPRQRSGAAGGMLATARLLGQTTGAVAVGVAFHLVRRRRGSRAARGRRHRGADRRGAQPAAPALAADGAPARRADDDPRLSDCLAPGGLIR